MNIILKWHYLKTAFFKNRDMVLQFRTLRLLDGVLRDLLVRVVFFAYSLAHITCAII